MASLRSRPVLLVLFCVYYLKDVQACLHARDDWHNSKGSRGTRLILAKNARCLPSNIAVASPGVVYGPCDVCKLNDVSSIRSELYSQDVKSAKSMQMGFDSSRSLGTSDDFCPDVL